ncbi:SCP2 sterol-binding domain-containing protein [Thermomonospora cellulosilytica]|uniref:SCP2 domain-containing protein n=1 Tax=Thermomonospora cellulosilytica TaxID=1411118 RepID=A0A7W3N004_9ACTN|nr:SCP2 sterol-binding domain-containing protein [Thermomonospora cellulosilytica]MBA9005000.1 hypothetical protein [Thermomonospora cellulosilytica]
MSDRRLPADQIERLRADPVFADFLSPFPRLLEPGESELGRSFERIGELAGGSDTGARIRFAVHDGSGRDVGSWTLTQEPDGCTVGAVAASPPDAEILITEEAWRSLAEGALSPLEAFGRGGVRLRGDVEAVRRLVRSLRRT